MKSAMYKVYLTPSPMSSVPSVQVMSTFNPPTGSEALLTVGSLKSSERYRAFEMNWPPGHACTDIKLQESPLLLLQGSITEEAISALTVEWFL